MPRSADNSSLEDIKVPELSEPGAAAAALFNEEKADLDKAAEREAAGIANDTARARLEQLNQDRIERKTYAYRLFCLTAWWISFIGLLTVWNGYRDSRFHISDTVLLGLIGSTTTGVISIFLIVANYLFPKPKD